MSIQGIGVEQAKQVQNQIPVADQNKNIGELSVSSNNEGLNRAENVLKAKGHVRTSESNIEINQLKNNLPLSIEEVNMVAEMNTKSAKAVDYTVCAKTMTAIGTAITTLGTLIFGVIFLSRDRNESHTAAVEEKRLEACKEGVKRLGEAIIKNTNDTALILKTESDITKTLLRVLMPIKKVTFSTTLERAGGAQYSLEQKLEEENQKVSRKPREVRHGLSEKINQSHAFFKKTFLRSNELVKMSQLDINKEIAEAKNSIEGINVMLSHLEKKMLNNNSEEKVNSLEKINKLEREKNSEEVYIRKLEKFLVRSSSKVLMP